MSTDKPAINPYLWAIGSATAQIPTGETVANRYQVVAPQIWQDMQPTLAAELPEQISDDFLPYLRLYPQRLHLPEVYGICQLDRATEKEDSRVILLDNVPIDKNGKLLPSLESMWPQASSVRQLYWLWQMLELWTPLAEIGVASSLLIPENLRVEGWRLRLRQLYPDLNTAAEPEVASVSANGEPGNGHLRVTETPPGISAALKNSPIPASLERLGECWDSWCAKASVSVVSKLREMARVLRSEQPSLKEIATELNQLLLEQASILPLRLQVVGATDAGPAHDHNEDSCYPTKADLPSDPEQPSDPLIPSLSIICDGIGGHEGGEVASQLAVQSVKLQVRGLLAELTEDPEIMTPELVAQQLQAIIRVANNLIASRNDEQERASRQRMATTLIMALQLPQILQTTNGKGNSHELYITSVGDSRAYWLTPRYCQQLTVDDDVATREVRMGRSLYQGVSNRPDAGALTQAVGTRNAELLRPKVRRFILEEDGLLLLCSDGLSDNNLIERFCQDYPQNISSGKLSLEGAVESLIQLANQKNGHDNVSVVLTHCSVSPQYPVVLNLADKTTSNQQLEVNLDTEVAGSAQAPDSIELATREKEETETVNSTGSWFKVILGLAGVLVVLISAGAALLTAQWLLNPKGFEQMRDLILPGEEETIPQFEEETTPQFEEEPTPSLDK